MLKAEERFISGWVSGGRRRVLFAKRYKGTSLGTENILYLDLDGVYTILSICKKIHPAIYLRLVYFIICYSWTKLFLKDLCICVYYLENPEGFFFSGSLMSPSKVVNTRDKHSSNFQLSVCLEKLPSCYKARGSQLIIYYS